MEFSFSQLLVLLFLLLPLIERFFGKKKAGQKNAPEPVEYEPDYDADEPATEMTWEETLEQLESVIKGEASKPKPAPVPVPASTPGRLTQTYTMNEPVRREFVGREFKSEEAHFRSESLLDTPLVSATEDLEVRTSHVKVTRQSLREAIVINEILAPPVSRRARALNRVS